MSEDGWDLTGIPPKFWPYVLTALERINPVALRAISQFAAQALGVVAAGPDPVPWRSAGTATHGPQPEPWRAIATTVQTAITIHYVAALTPDQAVSAQLRQEAQRQMAGAVQQLQHLDKHTAAQ